MGLTYADCERLGIAHLHPDHPDNRAAVAVSPPSVPQAPRRSKYGATPTVYNGVRYSSKAEANRAEVLDHEVRTSRIRFWIGQPKFRLGLPECVYVADFLVVGFSNVWVEDTKGVETPKFARDKKLWARYGPCPLRVLRKGKVVEVIEPEAKRG